MTGPARPWRVLSVVALLLVSTAPPAGAVGPPPVDEKQASDKALESVFKADKKDAEASRRRAQVEEEWASRAKANYAKAIELANAAR